VSHTSPQEVTRLLRELGAGRSSAQAELLPLVYEELRRLARAYLRRERPDHTLQPTALVHEAYLRLARSQDEVWQDRAHFFGIAARLMRQILVNHAKAHDSAKRGGPARKLPLDEANALRQPPHLLALDEALQALARTHPRQSEVVELKFFGGLEAREIAEVLGVSEKTVLRDWNFAKLWLYRELSGEGAS
jgi:RNA polymerase sigma factor (TIGR02999 family)